MQGYALTVVASGFLDPMQNNDEGFGLWVALPSGGPLVELPNTTAVGVEDNRASSINLKLYPNPAREVVNIQYENGSSTSATLRSAA